MSLNYPNFVQARLNKYEPALFSKSSPNFNSYSRTCLSNMGRQPILLTDEEKEKIDKKHPGSYTHSIRYGSDSKKKYNYICPRYWCLKTNMSITEEEVKKGVCGGPDAIIPRGSRVVPPGKSIYEFNAPKEHVNEKDGSYIQHYPGFLTKNKLTGDCLPCCFKKWDSASQIQRRKECLKEEEISKTKKKADELDEYIKGHEKFPLQEMRWGYLPLSVQLFLNIDNANCQENNSSKKPKVFQECILRRGVENHATQSFVACIADIYVNIIQSKSIPSIVEMKKYIIEAIDLDSFLTYQNGNLISIFSKIKNEEISIEDYSETKLYKLTDSKNNSQLLHLKNVINAFINFKNYLADDEVEIDYKYLWDIICNPNPKLFEKGLNLIILEIPDDDITDNIEIVCPSNHYSDSLFDSKKPCIILIKKNNMFEPIYVYKDVQTRIEIQKKFSIKSSNIMESLKLILIRIKEHITNHCGIIDDKMTVYEYKQNITASNLKEELMKIKDVEITEQVLNYNSKIIGLLIKYKGLSGFLPCYPSSTLSDLNIKFMDEVEWNSYDNTIEFLTTIKTANNNIFSAPMNKIEEQGVIVGILTETNQFIQINPPEQSKSPDYPIISNSNYIVADDNTLNNSKMDEDRINYIKKLKLEDNFYNVFRNMLRIILNSPENKLIKKEFIDVIESNDVLYFRKMETIIEKLKNLLEEGIEFTEINEELLKRIDKVSSCKNVDDCDKPYCIRTEDDSCKLMIPSKNLLNEGIDNEPLYYERLADELIRFNRIRVYIFDENLFLSYGDMNYNLNNDEIIIFQSELTQSYFDNLKNITENIYTDTGVYDLLNTENKRYSNRISELDKKIITNDNCDDNPKKISGFWGTLFPKKFVEIKYNSSQINCGFQLMLDIISDSGNKDQTILSLKELLIKQYTVNYKSFLYKIYEILYNEGKKAYISQIYSKKITLSDFIMSENYFITILDIWMISQTLSIPIILLSATQNFSINKKKSLVLKYSPTNNYYILKSSSMGFLGNKINKRMYPEYRILMESTSKKIINLDNIERNEGKINPKDLILDEGIGIKFGKDNPLLSYLTQFKGVKKRLIIKNS